MKIIIGNDHAGLDLKNKIIEFLKNKNISYKNLGTDSVNSVDYPDFAHQLAQSIENGSNDLGIQFCGSGNGINMSANKHQAIRSALCWEVEIAELARLHNDANVCTMPARFISFEKVLSIIDVFLNTDFEGGRHQRRVNKISC